MSVQRATAQRPSNKFVLLNASAEFFTAANLTSALSAATLRDGSIYLFATRAALSTALAALNSAGTAFSALTPTGAIGDSITDIGRTVLIGVAGDESRMVKLRAVQLNANTTENDGQGATGFVVTEVNLDAADNASTARMVVGVARV